MCRHETPGICLFWSSFQNFMKNLKIAPTEVLVRAVRKRPERSLDAGPFVLESTRTFRVVLELDYDVTSFDLLLAATATEAIARERLLWKVRLRAADMIGDERVDLRGEALALHVVHVIALGAAGARLTARPRRVGGHCFLAFLLLAAIAAAALLRLGGRSGTGRCQGAATPAVALLLLQAPDFGCREPRLLSRRASYLAPLALPSSS